MSKILCVEDDDDLRVEIAEDLRGEGYRVFEARDAGEALEILRQALPDLVLCDVTMPGLSGHELLQDIRQNHPEYGGIPFLFLSALAGRSDIIAGLRLGADDYLSKPVDFEKLRLKVSSSLRLRNAYDNQLLYVSTTDAKTGLPNRRGAQQYIHEKLIANTGDLAIICIGLNEFKQAGGAPTYDEEEFILRQTAERLTAIAKDRNPDDFVAFLENGIFLYVATNIRSLAIAEAVLRASIEKLNYPLDVFGYEIHVSVHAGICIPQEVSDTSNMMIDGAMMALVQAQRQNVSYRLYRTAMKTMARRAIKMKSSLREALEKGEFFLEYQPLVDAQCGNLVGAEALLRWKSSEQGLISPDQFIPLAEQSREIIPIGRWVLETAIAQASRWDRDHHARTRISVNFSAYQFQQGGIVRIVAEALSAHGLDPECLDIEITERMLLLDNAVTHSTISGLVDMGVRLSIDDFGTGYSSVGSLKNLPFNTVKIDRSFVENITSSNRDAVLVDTLIKMSHDLGMEVVAEGVETPAQLDLLRRWRCEMIQGFLIGRPMSPENLERLFLENRPPRQGSVQGAEKNSHDHSRWEFR